MFVFKFNTGHACFFVFHDGNDRFGIYVVLVVEMAQITPPVGFNLFVLQGMTKKEITWLARHSMPMFFLMVGAVLLIYFFPGIITWLPQHMAG